MINESASLALENVTKSHGEGAARDVVLRDINLHVRPGEFLVIVGCSGAGKSTLMSLLAGLAKPDSGRVLLRGKPIEGPGIDRGIVFQHYSLLPWLSVFDNVALAVDQAFAAERAERRRERVEYALELVNLSHAIRKRPHELSGGMKQRVAVARALAMNPAVLLLDEPFGALDALTRSTLQSELERIWRTERKTVVMISNDVDEALLLADRVAPLRTDGTLGEPILVDCKRPRRHEDLDEDRALRCLRQAIPAMLRVAEPKQATGNVVSLPHTDGRPEDAARRALLRLERISKSFDGPQGLQEIVRDVEFAIAPGEFVSLIGHSGCGKSTVMSMIAGLTTPSRGAIYIEDARVEGPGPERALVFQSPSLLPWLSAADNVRLGVDRRFPDKSAEERADIVNRYLDLVGLSHARNKRPADLSAGMRQRVGVARAFALNPRLLLLDEPFGMLDSVTRIELQNVLIDLWQSSRASALLITHDVDEALFLSDRILLMTDGPSATLGKTLEVGFPRPRVRKELVDTPAYRELRAALLDFLEHTSRRAQSTLAGQRAPERTARVQSAAP
jgi:nitrate/nitrite transport system ATP-binding protein